MRVLIVSEPSSGELGFATMDVARDEVVDAWSYYGLEHLSATRARMVGYSAAVARTVALAAVTDRLAEQSCWRLRRS